MASLPRADFYVRSLDVGEYVFAHTLDRIGDDHSPIQSVDGFNYHLRIVLARRAINEFRPTCLSL